jgi:Plasmid pRiA4b ORF-3-like protein
VDTVEDLRDAARRARECAVMGQAVTLARWIGNGCRPVTAGRVLRKADIPAAGAALGVDVPVRLRTMADALRQPLFEALQVLCDRYAAAAALEDNGPDEALSRLWDAIPGEDLDARLAEVRATGHPEAGPLARAVAEFIASGAPRSIDEVVQLKVALARVRPPIWRRVMMPATAALGDLHEVIQVLFGWDGDHLHLFQKGKKRYGDPFVNLEGTGDEDTVRVRDAMAPGGMIAYTYDLGACWEHEITLEATVPRDQSHDYPLCVEFRGDSPRRVLV